MRSLEILYTFELSVSDVEQGHYEDARVQLPAHPEEPVDYTISRALAFAHCLPFQPKLGDGWYNLKKPTRVSLNATEQENFWAHVGDVDKKLAKFAERQHSQSRLRFYFYTEAQIQVFCHHLRGSKENWISTIDFYAFEPSFIERLSEIGLERRNLWQVNYLEGAIYLSAEDETYSGSFEKLDMWKFYQESLEVAV